MLRGCGDRKPPRARWQQVPNTWKAVEDDIQCQPLPPIHIHASTYSPTHAHKSLSLLHSWRQLPLTFIPPQVFALEKVELPAVCLWGHGRWKGEKSHRRVQAVTCWAGHFRNSWNKASHGERWWLFVCTVIEWVCDGASPVSDEDWSKKRDPPPPPHTHTDQWRGVCQSSRAQYLFLVTGRYSLWLLWSRAPVAHMLESRLPREVTLERALTPAWLWTCAWGVKAQARLPAQEGSLGLIGKWDWTDF